MVSEHRPRETVLLVGCGQLGTALGRTLLDRGHRVIALRRDPSGLPEGFERLAVDLAAEPQDVAGSWDAVGTPHSAGPRGALAGLAGLPPLDRVVVTLPPIELPDGGNGTALAVRRLAAALPTAPRRTVYVSSTRVFDGVSDTRPLTEADVPIPASARASALLETERAAVEHLGALLLRPAGIYGPGRDFLVRAVRAGRPVKHARLSNRIHEADLVRAIDALLFAPRPPAVLHAVDQAPAPTGEVLAHIAGLLGLPVPPDAGGTPEGRVFDGGALLGLLGHLEFPGHVDGYAAMLADDRT